MSDIKAFAEVARDLASVLPNKCITRLIEASKQYREHTINATELLVVLDTVLNNRHEAPNVLNAVVDAAGAIVENTPYMADHAHLITERVFVNIANSDEQYGEVNKKILDVSKHIAKIGLPKDSYIAQSIRGMHTRYSEISKDKDILEGCHQLESTLNDTQTTLLGRSIDLVNFRNDLLPQHIYSKATQAINELPNYLDDIHSVEQLILEASLKTLWPEKLSLSDFERAMVINALTRTCDGMASQSDRYDRNGIAVCSSILEKVCDLNEAVGDDESSAQNLSKTIEATFLGQAVLLRHEGITPAAFAGSIYTINALETDADSILLPGLIKALHVGEETAPEDELLYELYAYGATHVLRNIIDKGELETTTKAIKCATRLVAYQDADDPKFDDDLFNKIEAFLNPPTDDVPSEKRALYDNEDIYYAALDFVGAAVVHDKVQEKCKTHLVSIVSEAARQGFKAELITPKDDQAIVNALLSWHRASAPAP